MNYRDKLIPGGVNSPARAFKAVATKPLTMRKAKGSYISDTLGKRYLDFCMGWGSMIMGHAHKRVTHAVKNAVSKGSVYGFNTKSEVQLAEIIVDAFPSIDQIRFMNSGTEAVMTAIRLARAFTQKDTIIKFEGCYHGHADYLLSKSGSGLATYDLPFSLGVPQSFTQHTVTIPYNNVKALKETIVTAKETLAAIIVEPIAGNMGLVLPEKDFLESILQLSREHGVVIIFDEVITGFRATFGGAQTRFNLTPDLTCLGKIIGGGLPIGAVGGRKEIMELLAPNGGVYQAGTFSGNPVAMQGGLETLRWLRQHQHAYMDLEQLTSQLVLQMEAILRGKNIAVTIPTIASMFSFFFTDEKVKNYEDAKTSNSSIFIELFQHLLRNNILLPPSNFETCFLSFQHDASNTKRLLKAIATFEVE